MNIQNLRKVQQLMNFAVRETCYRISKHVLNDGLEITRQAQDINIIKGQLRELGRHLEFPFTKFSIPSQHKSIFPLSFVLALFCF